jgi:DNA-binding NarL/FixJ family response regulator
VSKIRVLVTDDHAIVRQGICALLELCADIQVIGEAADGNEAVKKVHELSPDVVVMDITMPIMDGIEATTRICKQDPRTKVVVLTQHDSREYITYCIKAGAAACVPKKTVASDLILAIKTVYQGGSFLVPNMAKMLFDDYRELLISEPGRYDSLSNREREVLKLFAVGRTSREISKELFISIKTARNHKANIMNKLQIHNNTDLIKYAIRKGLTSLDK